VILHNLIVEEDLDNYELALNYNIVEDNVLELIVSHDHHPCYAMSFNNHAKFSTLKHI